MLSTSIESASDLNNESLKLLSQAGEDDQLDTRAITMLSQALATMRNVATQGSTSGGLDVANHAHPQHVATKNAASLPPILRTSSDCVLKELSSPDAFIFNRCISIDLEASQENAQNVPLFSACIITNLALALHRRSMNDAISTSQSKNCLRKAQKMYHMALQLLQGPLLRNGIISSHQQQEATLSLKLIAWNNLAVISFSEDATGIQQKQQRRDANHSHHSALLFRRLWNGLQQFTRYQHHQRHDLNSSSTSATQHSFSILTTCDLRCLAVNLAVLGGGPNTRSGMIAAAA